MAEVGRYEVRPWFDEGDDWPEEPGPAVEIVAESPDEARAEWRRRNPTASGIAWIDVTRLAVD